ncbi:MAG: hypothetical protein Q9201_004199 [Fulgogasparrea decipioides]
MRRTRSAPTASKAHVRPGQNMPRPIWPRAEGLGNQARGAQQSTTAHVPYSQYMAPGGTPERPLGASQLSGVAPPKAETLDQRAVTSPISMTSTSHRSEESAHPTAKQLDAHDRSSFKGPLQVTSIMFRGSEENSSPKSAGSCLDQQTFSLQPSTITSDAASVNTVVRNESDKAQANPPQPRDVEDDLCTVYKAASPLLLPIQSNARGLGDNGAETTSTATKSPPQQPKRLPSLLCDDKNTLRTAYYECSLFDRPLSPYCLSQPESPSVRDFEEGWASESNHSELACGNDALENSPQLGNSSNLLQLPLLPSPGFSIDHLSEDE